MNLYYCSECSRVFKGDYNCPHCNGEGVTLKKNSPVNVIGTKVKGRIFNCDDEKVSLIVRTEDNSRVIKEYLVNNLRKIL